MIADRFQLHSTNQYLDLPLLAEKNITLAIKREDLLHPYISGNKYRKLKYNLMTAKKQGSDTLLTFGGAFSNHIAAVAYAGKERGIKTIGVIRGEELYHNWYGNPTLDRAYQDGMQFKFVSRQAYKEKDSVGFIAELSKEYGDFYLVPEGGTNPLAVKGCEEILTEEDAAFNIITSCVGTGGTIAGLINSANEQQQVLGFPALKGDFLHKTLAEITVKDNWSLIMDYHFGGYAKITSELVRFINTFKTETGIPLDPVYTGKMLFGLLDMIKNDNFARGTKILAVHTGGLQGVEGMNTVLRKKNLPLLDL
ncbi:1-aminocyclopropane-1-carboxylate deaminase/D-cysteine desulfhydrase [Maribacter chungangensis]|uniref:1-aminocyclopropane-1-carboxylate deaminase/D-cysteine desulfhydrase n=1 Tax=Maribacter chungangensis TaxID=1069117 RepID=A0ABW3B7I9_9FLAO